jgi:formamidopyrimidine-DNA glycosylase
MPEGVEVKISADLIKPLLVNKTVTNVNISSTGRYRQKNPKGLDKFLEFIKTGNCKIENIQTRGKFMYWTFSECHYLMNTFGMSGQWSSVTGKHPCVTIEMGSESITFNDPRHFGTIQFVPSYALLNLKLSELGWDPLNHGMDERWINFITNKLVRTAKPIGQLLMDQTLFAGIGNYIRAELLYLAKISPWRTASLLTKDEIKLICQSAVDVMNESYKHQGATILTYKDAYGAEGKYSSCFKVYNQKLDPLGNMIKKENTPEGRTIHWCPTIQI